MTILRLNGFHSLNVLPTKTKTQVLKCIRAPGSKITCHCMEDKVFGYQNLTASSGFFSWFGYIHIYLVLVLVWFWFGFLVLDTYTFTSEMDSS